MSEKYLGENSTPILINQIKEKCTLKVSTLPTASADELGKIYQYIGTTSGSIVHNYFYECVSDGQDPATYSWQNVSVQPTATPSASGTTFDNTTSGLQATNVQGAIDEVESRVDTAESDIDGIEGKIPSTATTTNKLVDHDSLGTAAFKDSTDRVSPNNTALVESQSVYSAINTALSSIYTPRGDITCAELTSDLLIAANVGNIYETSDSGTTTALFLQGAGVSIPVGSNVGIISAGQGRILFNLMANAFDLTDYQKKDLASTIEGATTVEGALGALSTNKATQAEVNDIVNVLGAKNLLPNNAVSQTINGVTFTVNADGSITVNGTASAIVALEINQEIPLDSSKSYILNGCADGGEWESYRLDVYEHSNGLGFIGIQTTEELIISNKSSAVVRIRIASGTVISNKTFKPMLRLASDPDNTYEPYAKTNQQLTAENEALTNNINVNGSKNVLASLTPSGTYLGITISRNESGDIVVNGTATASPTTISLFDRTFKHIGEATILKFTDLGIDKTKKYVFSRAEKVSNFRYNIRVMNGTTQVAEIELGNNDGLYTVIDFSQYTCDGLKADIVVANGTTITNKVFSAMLCLESDYDLDPTYQPYAMTNRQITPYVQAISNPNLIDNPWFTINQRGATSTMTTWTQFKYGVDRWLNFSSTKQLILTNDGISELNGGIVTLYQIFDTVNDSNIIGLYGKTLTLSILYANGVIEHGTALLPLSHLRPSSRQDVRFINTTNYTSFAQIENYSTRMNVVFEAKAGMTIKAVKLEIGSVSTLAMDTAPNYQQELAKCQRYFQRIGKTSSSTGLGIAIAQGVAYSSNSIWMPVYLPVPMRLTPTLKIVGTLAVTASSISQKTADTSGVLNVGVVSTSDTNTQLINLYVDVSGGLYTVGTWYKLCTPTTSTADYIELSADL